MTPAASGHGCFGPGESDAEVDSGFDDELAASQVMRCQRGGTDMAYDYLSVQRGGGTTRV